MTVINKGNAAKLRKEVQEHDPLGEQMAKELLNQFNDLHSQNIWSDKEIEELLLRQHVQEVAAMSKRPTYPKHLVKFNPSGASATVMDLYLKAKKFKEKRVQFPYHKRWTRNSTAVHEAVQRDLLYTEKYTDNKFRVARTKEGLPAWESNILRWKKLEYGGKEFILNGMMDGVLIHNETGKRVGFELKTKSNTLGQVGHYRLKKPADYHVEQCVAYYLLTGIREYLLTYEGVAKPQWTANEDAKPDLRVFHVNITDEMAEALLKKWAYVVDCVENDTPPEDKTLGFFSGFGYLLDEDGNIMDQGETE